MTLNNDRTNRYFKVVLSIINNIFFFIVSISRGYYHSTRMINRLRNFNNTKHLDSTTLLDDETFGARLFAITKDYVYKWTCKLSEAAAYDSYEWIKQGAYTETICHNLNIKQKACYNILIESVKKVINWQLNKWEALIYFSEKILSF